MSLSKETIEMFPRNKTTAVFNLMDKLSKEAREKLLKKLGISQRTYYNLVTHYNLRNYGIDDVVDFWDADLETMVANFNAVEYEDGVSVRIGFADDMMSQHTSIWYKGYINKNLLDVLSQAVKLGPLTYNGKPVIFKELHVEELVLYQNQSLKEEFAENPLRPKLYKSSYLS